MHLLRSVTYLKPKPLSVKMAVLGVRLLSYSIFIYFCNIIEYNCFI